MQNIKELKFHTLSPEDSFASLHSSVKGLSDEDAARRIETFGYNEITVEEKESPLKLFLGQFANFLIMTLVIASVISAMMGKTVEAVSIIVIVVLAGVLGFLQEYQAGKAIESLKKMAAPKAIVVRDGEEIVVESRFLVPGDVVILKTGDTVPADGRLIESMNLKVEEAALTGESHGVDKKASVNVPEGSALGDRINMVFSGTSVSVGRGKVLVTSTGNNSEFGKIADMLKKTPDKKTPLQKNLDSLGSKIGIFALVIAVVMSIAGVLSGYEVLNMFIRGVALAVAVIPEALPAVVTVSLALGVRRMVKRRALIRKLPAVETLGAVNIICSDKTGTLTEDKMTVQKVYADGKELGVSGVGYDPEGKFSFNNEAFDTGNEVLKTLLLAGSLCNDSRLKKNDRWKITGDPTEGALCVLAAKGGLDSDELRKRHERIDEFPFTSEKKRMTTVNKFDDGIYAFSKGAGEIILHQCTRILTSDGVRDLTEEDSQKLHSVIETFGASALRVIGLANKKIEGEINESAGDGMVFIGFAGMIDPPRPQAVAAIIECGNAGIKPVMITGDHKITAVAIARELGIMRGGRAYSGEEIDNMSDDEFSKAVAEAEVFARISPAHKMKIVDLLMQQGNIVAMTGDGVNDAPSLKKANIGIAMGITGTDVSKEASDMILTDDNFASIVSAIEEGRTIFENIRKYLVYLLSGNMGTVFGIVAAMAAGLPLPLTAVQILFINFVMDGFIAIALGVEGPEPGIMKKYPRRVSEGILNRMSLVNIVFIGLWIAVITTSIYVWSIKNGVDEKTAGTIFFAALIFARLFNGFGCRSMDQSLFRINLFSNKALLASIAVTLFLVILIINTPLLNKAFSVVTLDPRYWIIVIVAAFSVTFFSEALKIFNRHFLRKGM